KRLLPPKKSPEWAKRGYAHLLYDTILQADQGCDFDFMTAKGKHQGYPRVTVQAQKLIDFVADIFSRAGSSAAEAKRVATYLTIANLTGHDSHGVIRVQGYVKSTLEGVIKADQTVEVMIDTPSFAVVDGKFGF